MQNKLNNFFNINKCLYLELHIVSNIFVQHYINKIYLIFFKFTKISNNKILFNNLKILFLSETNIIVK